MRVGTRVRVGTGVLGGRRRGLATRDVSGARNMARIVLALQLTPVGPGDRIRSCLGTDCCRRYRTRE